MRLCTCHTHEVTKTNPTPVKWVVGTTYLPNCIPTKFIHLTELISYSSITWKQRDSGDKDAGLTELVVSEL